MDKFTPDFDPLDRSWEKNPLPEKINFDDKLNVPGDFYNDLGKDIVNKYKKDKEELARIVDGLGTAHTLHSQESGRYQKSLADLFADSGVSDLINEIQTFESGWNGSLRAKMGNRVKVNIPLFDTKSGPLAQLILRGVEKAMHR